MDVAPLQQISLSNTTVTKLIISQKHFFINSLQKKLKTIVKICLTFIGYHLLNFRAMNSSIKICSGSKTPKWLFNYFLNFFLKTIKILLLVVFGLFTIYCVSEGF
jgi:hypothetical protein